MPGGDREARLERELAQLRGRLARRARELAGSRRELARLRQIMDWSMDPIFLHDRVGRILDCNRRACEVLGYSRDELLTMEVQDFSPDLRQIPSARRGENWDRMVLGEPVTVIGQTACRDGRLYPAEIKIGVFLDGGERRFVAIVRDVTEREQAAGELARLLELAQTANRAKSEFLAHMSHELRTPLNAIIGYSELLVDEVEEPETRADLEKIRAAGRHLLGTINDILDLSKIEAGRLELHIEPAELGSVIDGVLAVSGPLALTNNNRLEIDLVDSPCTVCTDAVKLRQVLLNLIGNAAKFTADGTITLRFARTRRRGDDWVRFEVEDTGVGISSDQLERMFEPFAQAARSDVGSDPHSRGTGLGLAISRHYCAQLGGEIHARSVLGEGSTFVIELPVDASAHRGDEAGAPAPASGLV